MKLSNDSEKGLEKSMTFQRKIIILIILILAISVIGYFAYPTITSYIIKEEKYSFEQGLKEVKQIEKDFNFSQGYPESLDAKWSMLGYLSNIKNYVENLPKDGDINALYYYILFRTKELESKIKFQMATLYKLRITEDNTLICPKRESFNKRMQYFNESVELGNEAVTNLNILIKDYPKYFDMTEIERITPKLLEAQYYQIEEDRKEEEKTVNNLCFN